jgi:putative DNA primase/helicase
VADDRIDDSAELKRRADLLEIVKASGVVGLKKVGREWSCRCPFHDDKTPSLFVDVTQSPQVWVCRGCGKGGTAVDFLVAGGMTTAAAFEDLRKRYGPIVPPDPRVVAAFRYTDDEGRLLYTVERWEPGRGADGKANGSRKSYAQVRPDGVRKAAEVQVPYRLPSILQARELDQTVYICEGEPAADAVVGLGLCGTTLPGGASAGRQHWVSWAPEHFRGCRVILLPDHDEPGAELMRAAEEALRGVAASVRTVRLPVQGKGADAVEWVKAGGTGEQLEALSRQLGTGVRLASEIEIRRVDWLWRQWIPSGAITLIEGDPGIGKSTILYDLAARISSGRSMPDEPAQRRRQRGVVLLSAEDSAEHTVVPRLRAAGADLTRVAIMDSVAGEDGERRMPMIPDDLHHIERTVREIDAAIVVIDPLFAFLTSKVDAYSDHSSRQAMTGLRDLAERTGACVLAMRHLVKASGKGRRAIHQGGGSIAFTAAARCVITVARGGDHDEHGGVMAVAKCNLAAKPTPYSYRLAQTTRDAGGEDLRASDGSLVESSYVEWMGASTVRDADALIQGDEDREAADAMAEGLAWLREALAYGPVPSAKLRTDAQSCGLSPSTLERCRRQLGVVARRISGAWVSSLPEHRSDEPVDDRAGPDR